MKYLVFVRRIEVQEKVGFIEVEALTPEEAREEAGHALEDGYEPDDVRDGDYGEYPSWEVDDDRDVEEVDE